MRAGGRAIAVEADLTNEPEIEAMVRTVEDELGPVDVLVNNAGTTAFIPFADLEALDAGADEIMAVNCRAPYLASRAAARRMRSRGGAIVNVTSASAIRGGASSCIAYSASKAALQMLTECLALALAPTVRVNSVAPGGMLTRWGERWGAETLARQVEAIPLKRHARVEDVADGVLFALRNDSLTGQRIVVDSGWLLA